MEIRFDDLLKAVTPQMVTAHGLIWRIGMIHPHKVADAKGPGKFHRNLQGLQEDLNRRVPKLFWLRTVVIGYKWGTTRRAQNFTDEF